jgi:hypothetical protein
MKKLIIFISIILFTITTNAQELTGFMGIPFGSTKTEIKSMFLSKNPSAKIHTDDTKSLTFTDFNFGGRKAIAVIFGINGEGKMHTAIVLLNNDNDDEVFDLYDDVVSDINNKYHYRDVNNEIWKYPYDKSDKYQHGTTAMKLGKCTLQSMWYFDVNDPSSHDDDNIIAVENTESCSVKITYQNGIMISDVVSKNKEKNSQDY